MMGVEERLVAAIAQAEQRLGVELPARLRQAIIDGSLERNHGPVAFPSQWQRLAVAMINHFGGDEPAGVLGPDGYCGPDGIAISEDANGDMLCLVCVTGQSIHLRPTPYWFNHSTYELSQVDRRIDRDDALERRADALLGVEFEEHEAERPGDLICSECDSAVQPGVACGYCGHVQTKAATPLNTRETADRLLKMLLTRSLVELRQDADAAVLASRLRTVLDEYPLAWARSRELLKLLKSDEQVAEVQCDREEIADQLRELAR